MPQPFSFSVNVPRDNLAPYLQQRGQTLAGIAGSVGELTDAISATLQARAQAEKARRLAIQKENDRRTLLSMPTSSNILNYTSLYPEDAAKLEPSFARIAEEEKTSEFNALIGPYFAAQTDDVDTFKSGIDQRATALEKSEDPVNVERAKILRNISALADKNLTNAKLELGGRLAFIRPEQFKNVTEYMAGGRVAEDIEAQALAKAEFDAKKAAVDAKFAESQAVADLNFKKAQTENYAVMQDIARQNADIARQRLAIDREANQIKKDAMQAELDAKLAQRDQTLRERKAEMDKSLSKIQIAKDVALKILKTPRALRESVHGPASEAMRQAYPVATAMARGQDQQDYINLTDQFFGTVFLEGIEAMKSTGAISEKEGTKAASAATSANRSSSVDAMDQALIEFLQKLDMSERIAKEKYGAKPVAPSAAVPVSVIPPGQAVEDFD